MEQPAAGVEGEIGVDGEFRVLNWRSTRPIRNIGWSEADVDP